MRRGRSLRDFRDKMIRQRAIRKSERVKNLKIAKKKAESPNPRNSRHRELLLHRRRARKKLREEQSHGVDFNACPAKNPSELPPFLSYDKYEYKERTVVVLHIIESLGMGGAQTMMMELVNGLNKYYGDHIANHISSVSSKLQKPLKKLFQSYGVSAVHNNHSALKGFCKKNKVDVVVHHRIANSACLKKHLPPGVKYILLNHTWNYIHRIANFPYCDYYISVCEFLDKKTRKLNFLHPTRKLIILNGIENDYVAAIKPHPFSGSFKTGRCHRLVPSKFCKDSIPWMDRVAKKIRGHRHYLIGSNKDAKGASERLSSKSVEYMGPILDRNIKMSMIKAWDLYFYETTGNEGASIAILEGLACIPKTQKLFVNGRLRNASEVHVGDEIYGGRVLRVFDNGLSKLLEIKPLGLPPFRVTPDHRVRVYDRLLGETWKDACNLDINDYLIFPKYKFVSDNIAIDLSEYRQRRKCKVDITEIRITPGLAYLLGWYLAEGDSSAGVVTFSLSREENYVAHKLAHILDEELNLHLFQKKSTCDSSCVRWYFCHTVLSRWFKDIFGNNSQSKRIPEFILNLPVELLRRFLEGYAAGDGWYDPRKLRTVMCTASLELSYQLILAYSKLDQFAVWQKKVKADSTTIICNRKVNVHPSWNISVVPNHANSKKRYLQDECNFYLPISLSTTESEEVVNYTTDTSQYCTPFVATHNCGIPVVCKPIGGNPELVKNNVNGFIVHDRAGFLLVMKSMSDDHDHHEKMKEQVRKDFDERLHVRHTACKYMQLFEQLLKENV